MYLLVEILNSMNPNISFWFLQKKKDLNEDIIHEHSGIKYGFILLNN